MYSNQFAKLWSKLSKDMKAHMESGLSPSLTESQLHVLEYLIHEEGRALKPSDLIEFLETTPAAITTLLDRMEKNGLVARERDGKDRRIVWVNVTEKGRYECAKGIELREKFLEAYLSRISAHNQQLLVYLLGKMANPQQTGQAG